MKKLLLIALLIVGCVFGDTIKYKSSLFITDTIENVEFLGVGRNQSICFKSNNDVELLEFSGETYSHSTILIDCVLCRHVKEVNVGGVVLDFDCNKRTYYGKQPNIEKLKFSLVRFGFMTAFLIFVTTNLPH